MELDITKLLWQFGSVGMRVTGICLLAPFVGGIAVPIRVKVAFTVALTVLLSPHVAAPAPSAALSSWMQLAIGEVAIGMLLGLTLQYVFEAAQFAGSILGVQMGFSLVNLMDPQTQVDTPVLAIFQQLATLLVFLELNVHHWLLRGVARSFEYLPPGRFAMTWPASEELLRGAGGVFLVGVQIAAPVLAATMLADVALGFLGKAAPQLPVLFVGLSVKCVLGLGVMAAAVLTWHRFLEQQFVRAIEAGERILVLAH